MIQILNSLHHKCRIKEVAQIYHLQYQKKMRKYKMKKSRIISKKNMNKQLKRELFTCPGYPHLWQLTKLENFCLHIKPREFTYYHNQNGQEGTELKREGAKDYVFERVGLNLMIKELLEWLRWAWMGKKCCQKKEISTLRIFGI